MKKRTLTSLLLLVLALGFVLGRWPEKKGADKASSAEAAASFWTCSMHPQVKKPGKGKCPYCGMDLIPVATASGGETLGAREIQLSPQARRLAAVETTRVERRYVDKTVRMSGKVDYDESRVSYITARVAGRMDRLYVDFTGVPVKKGDHLVYLYSPELLAAQEELIQAAKTAAGLTPGVSELIRERTLQTLDSTREKLRLYDLTPEQVAAIEQRGTASDHITLFSPTEGIVVEKHGSEGSYVNTGSKIYTIADLSRVWVKLDAYESDLAWVRYGQEVHFETEAFPGMDFAGKIAFIDPVLNPATRTVKVRVNVPNPDQLLKPGLFVRATVKVPVGGHGRVVAPDLAGKWISPMHPEIVKDGPGTCDVCGMDLVPAASLGYASESSSEAPLVIPRTAPLITGKRAVVYVQDPKRAGIYAGREVVLGARAGDFYVVQEGLQEGELVVSSGAFKIDSAVQIQAKPSMMNPGPDRDNERYETPEAFRAQLSELLIPYLALQQALADDQLHPAHEAAGAMSQSLERVNMSLLKDEVHQAWMKQHTAFKQGLAALGKAGKIGEARKAFETLSIAMITVTKQFAPLRKKAVYEMHCPMAFDFKGASWLQEGEAVLNPYFGAEMLQCGEIDAVYEDGRRKLHTSP